MSTSAVTGSTLASQIDGASAASGTAKKDTAKHPFSPK